MKHTNDALHVNSETYSEIMDCLRDGKKIGAIKALRNYTGGSLKESKWAIDLLYNERFKRSAHYSHNPEAKKILCGPKVIGVTLDYGDGPVEVDMENMQLRALTELGSLGVETCIEMLKLVDIFNAIRNGDSIHVIKRQG